MPGSRGLQALQCIIPAGGVGGDGAEQLRQMLGTALIKGGVGAGAEVGHLLEALAYARVVALLEHKQRQTHHAQFARAGAEGIDRLLDGVADKNGGLHRLLLVGVQAVVQYAPDLGVAAQALYTAHGIEQLAGAVHPGAGKEFVKAPVVAELQLQAAQFPGSEEHAVLQLAGSVPGGLAAGGGIESEDQAAAAAGLTAGALGQLLRLLQKCTEVRRGFIRQFIGSHVALLSKVIALCPVESLQFNAITGGDKPGAFGCAKVPKGKPSIRRLMKTPELTPQHRAQLFSALLEQHDHQGDWDKLFQLLNEGQRAARSAQMPEVAEQMAQGKDIVLDGLRGSGKFLEWELAVLEVGLATANISESYRRLRDHYLLQQRFVAEAKQQCRWPFAIVAAVLVAMYLWLGLGGALSPLSALALCAGAIGLIAAIQWLVVWFSGRVLAGTAQQSLSVWVGRLPLMKGAYRAGQLLQFFRNLEQAVSAHLPLSQSLKLAAKKMTDGVCQRECMAVYDTVAQGGKLSAGLSSAGVLKGITLAPMSLRNAGPNEAMAHIADSVYTHYVTVLWQLARNFPMLLFVLLPIVASLQIALIS